MGKRQVRPSAKGKLQSVVERGAAGLRDIGSSQLGGSRKAGADCGSAERWAADRGLFYHEMWFYVKYGVYWYTFERSNGSALEQRRLAIRIRTSGTGSGVGPTQHAETPCGITAVDCLHV